MKTPHPRVRSRWGRLLALLAVATAVSSARAQETVVASPIRVPLERVTVGTGGSSYEKLGIWASLGGGEPQLFEFDTGGDGFYAVHAHAITPWWGRHAGEPQQAFNQTYSSGNVYHGAIVAAAVSLYASGTADTPLITTRPGVAVGLTRKIVNTRYHEVYWSPNARRDTAPPVDTVFYGDFGVNLVNKGVNRSVQRPTNVLAQLRYGPGVAAGFIVHAGPHGSRSGSYVQVGLTAADMAAFPIQIPMAQLSSTQPPAFPHSQLASWGLQLFESKLRLEPGSLPLPPPKLSLTIPMTLDTGNQTPLIYAAKKSGDFAGYLATYKGGTILLPGTTLDTDLVSGLASFDLVAGTREGVDKVDVSTQEAHHKFSFNVGMPFFEQYVVAFNLSAGIVGLRPQEQDPLDVHVSGREQRRTSDPRIVLTGTASGAGLRGVRIVANGRSTLARGRARWRATIMLQPGRTLVKAFALGPGSATSRPAIVRIRLR